MKRRDLLLAASRAALSGLSVSAVTHDVLPAQRTPVTSDLEQRVAAVIRAYDAQGYHRTGTDVDHESAKWLAAQVRQYGVDAASEPFVFTRIDPASCYLRVA